MGHFSCFQFILIFLVLKSEASSNSLNCDFNSNDCAWHSSDSFMPSWEWTGILERDGHKGYLEIPTKNASDIEELVSTSGPSQLTTSIHNLWHIPQSGCFSFSYRFHTTSDSKLNLTLENSYGKKQVLWDIKGPQSMDWSRASVYIDSSDSDFRLHFTGSIALKNSLGLQADWIISLDDFTFVNDKCFELTPNMARTGIEGSLTDIGDTIYTSQAVQIHKLACFSFTYFYTTTNAQNVGSLLIMLEKMSDEPRRMLLLEKISLQRELALNRNHFERSISVDRESFYTISLAYADKVHSSVVLVDDVSIKMGRCSNESPDQDSDTTTDPETETPSSTTTECCVTEPCICVKSTTEMPILDTSGVTTFVNPSTVSIEPISTDRIDQETSLMSTTTTENTVSEASQTEVVTAKDQSTTLETLSSTPVIFSTENIITERTTTDQSTTSTPLSSTEKIFSTEISEASTTQFTEAETTREVSSTPIALTSTQISVHSQTNETPLEEVTSSKSEIQSTSMNHIISTTTDQSIDKTEITNSSVVTTIDQKAETFETSTQNILTTNHQNTESISNTTQSNLILDIQTDETSSFNAINFGYLGRNLMELFKFFFSERSLIASLSGIAGLSILMLSIMILVLNWRKQDQFKKRPVVISAMDGELELNAYTFRRRTITLSRLESMSSSKPPLKFSKSVDV